jgi:hypothetical protein
MYWVEVRPTVRRSGAPKLVPLQDVNAYTGFRSAFAFPEDVAEFIREGSSTRDIQGLSVYSDMLFVDFDNQDSTTFREFLLHEGLSFTQWDSGHRSQHYHVALQAMEGPWVPLAQKNWTKAHAPTADISFLHAAGMYRLPRTYHAKTGKQKELIEDHAGKLLVIPPPNVKEFKLSVINTEKSEEDLLALLCQRATVGGRSMHLFKIAATSAELGHTPDSALEALRYWNANFAERPHSDSVLIRNCVSAFERVARRSS